MSLSVAGEGVKAAVDSGEFASAYAAALGVDPVPEDLAWPDRCWSFVRTGGQCYVVLSPGFNPSYDPAATSGVVAWPCRADDDCSLNGHCLAGRC